MHIAALLAVVALLAATPAHAAPSPTDRCCMTDPSAWYRDPPGKIARRFDLYRKMGVGVLRVEVDWRSLETAEGHWDPSYIRSYLELARRHGFRIKLILGVLMAPPGWFLERYPEARIVDENGQWSRNTMSFWYPGLRSLIDEKTRRIVRTLRDLRVLDLVDYVIPSLGPAGEAVYPVPWTLGPDVREQTYWCYDKGAQRDFRARMRRKYGTIAAANTRWGTEFTSWEAARVLPPGTRPGPYWDDVLTWYRDAKREFIRWQVESTRRHLGRDRRILIYVPGTAYSEAEWREAVATARGNDHVMMMADSFFLIDFAARNGCWLQYTGAENAPEVARLRRYMRERGHTRVRMWAENAGVLGAARDPLHLARVVIENHLFGLDYTHAHFAFEADGLTPNAVFPALEEAYARIRSGRGVR